MAIPVTDLHRRLREAGFNEPQAEAVTAGFEALGFRMDRVEARMADLEVRMARLEARFTAMFAIQVLILAAVLAPYVGTPLRST